MTDKGLDASDENITTLKENIGSLFGSQSSSSVDIAYNNFNSIYFTVDGANFTKGNDDSTVPDSGTKQLLIQFRYFETTEDMVSTNNVYDTFPLAFNELFFIYISIYKFNSVFMWNIASDDISSTITTSSEIRTNDLGFRAHSNAFNVSFNSPGSNVVYLAVGIV